MPGAGTDKTKNWVQQPGPVVILVEPQMGENIGSAARAMANFGLGRLRLVKPREAWPNPQAYKMASGADRVLDEAVIYATLSVATPTAVAGAVPLQRLLEEGARAGLSAPDGAATNVG